MLINVIDTSNVLEISLELVSYCCVFLVYKLVHLSAFVNMSTEQNAAPVYKY